MHLRDAARHGRPRRLGSPTAWRAEPQHPLHRGADWNARLSKPRQRPAARGRRRCAGHPSRKHVLDAVSPHSNAQHVALTQNLRIKTLRARDVGRLKLTHDRTTQVIPQDKLGSVRNGVCNRSVDATVHFYPMSTRLESSEQRHSHGEQTRAQRPLPELALDGAQLIVVGNGSRRSPHSRSRKNAARRPRG